MNTQDYENEYKDMSPKVKGYLKEAILVQDACNLSGVVFFFANAMKAICDDSNRLNKGSNWKNHHPICILFSSKIASLTGSESFDEFHKAYEFCKKF